MEEIFLLAVGELIVVCLLAFMCFCFWRWLCTACSNKPKIVRTFYIWTKFNWLCSFAFLAIRACAALLGAIPIDQVLGTLAWTICTWSSHAACKGSPKQNVLTRTA